jgi:hypothetical protein
LNDTFHKVRASLATCPHSLHVIYALQLTAYLYRVWFFV